MALRRVSNSVKAASDARAAGFFAGLGAAADLLFRAGRWEDVPFSLVFDHRAKTAFRALSLRCFGVNAAARAGPPLIPPLRPRTTAAGFFFVGVCLGMVLLYVSGHESSTGSA